MHTYIHTYIERSTLIKHIHKTEKWPVTKNTLISQYLKLFKRFVDSIDFEKLQSDETTISGLRRTKDEMHI